MKGGKERNRNNSSKEKAGKKENGRGGVIAKRKRTALAKVGN